MAEKVIIGGELEPQGMSGVVTNSRYIKDSLKNKTQAAINEELYDAIGDIDAEATERSTHAVSSGGVYSDFEAIGEDIYLLNSVDAGDPVASDNPVAPSDYAAGDVFCAYQGDTPINHSRFVNARLYYVALQDGNEGDDMSSDLFMRTLSALEAIQKSSLIKLKADAVSVNVEQTLVPTQVQLAQRNIGLEKGVANGVASLDEHGVIPQSQVNAISLAPQTLNETQKVQAQNNMMAKSYIPAQFSGLGKKMLAKNIQQVGGVSKNVMTQAFFEDDQGNALTNTVFVIQYDYELGEDIEIGAECTLDFDGGSICGNYTITGNNTGIKAGITKIFDCAITFVGNWNINEVYPEWFGAKNHPILPVQDRVFSTDAFKAANKFVHTVSNTQITIKLSSHPEENDVSYVYLLSGDGIFGAESSSNLNEKILSIDGNGAKIAWYPQSESDILFNLDESHKKCLLNNFSIITYDDVETFSVKGTIFNINSVNTEANTKSQFTNLQVIGTTNKIKYVFKVTGSVQCDQTLVTNCSFAQFLNGFYCNNPEAVCWAFNSCSFHAGYHDSIIFDVIDIQDSLNVLNCSFGLCNGCKIIRANDFLDNTSRFNYNFINCRFETYTNDFRGEASSDDIYIECFDNKVNMTNCFFRASGSSTDLKVVSGKRGMITMNNCELKPVVLCSDILNVEYKGTSILIKDSDIPSVQYKCITWPTEQEYSLVDIMSDNTYCSIKPIVLENCTIGELRQRPWDYELVSDTPLYDVGCSRPVKVHSISYYRNDWASAEYWYSIPKYQAIKEINVYAFSDGYATEPITLKACFGDDNHYVEKTISTPSNLVGKTNLFSGLVLFNPNTITPQLKVWHTNNTYPDVKTFGMLIEIVYQAAPLVTLKSRTVDDQEDVIIFTNN